MSPTKLRGAEGAAKNTLKLQGYIKDLHENGRSLPLRGGDANRTAIAKACGFNRSVLYDNEECVQLLKDEVARHKPEGGSGGHSSPAAGAATDKQLKTLQNQIQRLETRIASLSAENADLRMKLKQSNAVADELIPSGKRIHLPFTENGETQ